MRSILNPSDAIRNSVALVTVMLVDDEEDIVRVTERLLKNEGYEVHTFHDPVTAMNHVVVGNCKQCSILISDIKMPNMSGFELARLVKIARPEMKTILTSSFVIHEGEFEKVLPSVKVDGFIGKPFSKADLIEAVKKYASQE